MNYSIIKDEKLLKGFIDWLPELQPHERFYMCLFARNKYCKELTHIKSDKAQLKRFVTDKERMFNKIQQLEIALDCYKQKETPVPERALALYIMPNPRHMYNAAINTMVKLAQAIRDQNTLMNVHQEALSEIQRTKSRTCFVDFDLDIQADTAQEHIQLVMDAREKIKQYVNPEAVTLLETRGGMHILIDTKKVDKEFTKTWHQNIAKIPGIDNVGDQMIPVPGCTQGDFIPHFINL